VGGHPRDLAEQTAAIEAVGAQPLWYGKHHLSVRDGRQGRCVQPLRPYGEANGVTAGAEVPALAGEGQHVLVRAGVAADTREAVLQDAAGEELVGYLADHRHPSVRSQQKQTFWPHPIRN